MTTLTTDLLLLEDLDVPATMSQLADSDRDALRAVGDWIRTFVVKPHVDLGRSGTVCPFVPGAIERKVHWLAGEQIGQRRASDVVELMNGYKRRLLELRPSDGGGTNDSVIVVVFTDLSPERAAGLFGEVLDEIAAPSYVDDGIVFGPFYDGHPGTAIYNPNFRPFQSPVPFLFVRHGVVEDWKFFLDQDDWLQRWARRFGESAIHALAGELRRLPWRVQR
jgi:hypothetical protein